MCWVPMAATFSGLGERKDKIVGTIAEPRECRFSTTLASQAKRPL
jgi:hypothetical protein